MSPRVLNRTACEDNMCKRGSSDSVSWGWCLFRGLKIGLLLWISASGFIRRRWQRIPRKPLIYFLIQTNRIARILAGSKKKICTKKPRFMSACAQLVIAFLLILLQLGIIVALLVIEPPQVCAAAVRCSLGWISWCDYSCWVLPGDLRLPEYPGGPLDLQSHHSGGGGPSGLQWPAHPQLHLLCL